MNPSHLSIGMDLIWMSHMNKKMIGKKLQHALIFLGFITFTFGYAEDQFFDYDIEDVEVEKQVEEKNMGRDLLDLVDSFVLEEKQIKIPEFPTAFNPSILRWTNSVLLSFRIYDYKKKKANRIGFVWLDEELNQISKPMEIQFRTTTPGFYSKYQDPRLISWKGRLHIVFNNQLIKNVAHEVRRMNVAEVFFDGSEFYIDTIDPVLDYDLQISSRSEKNWVPFIWEDQLFLSYSLNPHRIMQYDPSYLKVFSQTEKKLKWDWGTLRGGSPAELVDGEYLGFFHCSKSMRTVQSSGKSIPHYFMGAYTFSNDPPFDLKKISKKPIFGKTFYQPPYYKTWKPLRVVFPGGFIHDENFIWIAYGRQDHEVWVAKLDKKLLFKSLKDVK